MPVNTFVATVGNCSAEKSCIAVAVIAYANCPTLLAGSQGTLWRLASRLRHSE
jgi:hypothetical protein